MTVPIARRLAAAALLALTLAACSVSTESDDDGGSEPTPSGAEETGGADPADGGDDDRTPDVISGQTWLYEIDSDANFDSGGQVDVVVAGGDADSHPDSTAQWLGCDGVAAVTTYTLDGRYGMLEGTLAFREGTPAGVVAEVTIETDLGELGAYRVESDGGVPLQLVVEGAQQLVVTAELSAGRCEVDDDAYLVFVDTWLRRG